MVLITGGAESGAKDFALSIKKENDVIYRLDDLPIELGISDFDEEIIQKWWEDRNDEWDHLIFIHEEVGCGLVPESKVQRQQREIAGRIGCYFGKKANQVYRVCCGLGILIK